MSSRVAMVTCGPDPRVHRDPRATHRCLLADHPERSRAAAEARSDREVEIRDANQSLPSVANPFFGTVHAIVGPGRRCPGGRRTDSQDRMDRRPS